MTVSSSQRKVLLAVREGHLESRLFTSALELCRRLDADMEILLASSEMTLPAELDEFLDSLRVSGFPYNLQLKPALRRRDIVDYANSRECITAVIIDSRDGWEPLAQNRSSDPWRRLACPLVTAVPN